MNPTIRTTAAVVTFSLLIACDAGVGAGPSEVDLRVDAAAAMVAADAALEDLAAMDAFVPDGEGIGAPPGDDASAMGARDALVRERTVTFFDLSGAVQEDYDALATASILMTLTLEGEITRGDFSASLVRTRELRVSGLEGVEATRTFDGTGTEAHERTRVTDAFGTRSYSLNAEAVIDGVVRAVDRTEHPWPLAGTITRHVVVTLDPGAGEETVRERTVVITFDGTRYALLEVDGETFEVDLSEQGRDHPLHRRHGRG